jgi:hypothetical protein
LCCLLLGPFPLEQEARRLGEARRAILNMDSHGIYCLYIIYYSLSELLCTSFLKHFSYNISNKLPEGH